MKQSIRKLLLIMFFFVGITQATAQEDFEDDTEDVPEAPINSYVVPMLLVGVAAGYAFRKGLKAQNTKRKNLW